MSESPARLTAIAPVLLVKDVVAAANHYRDKMGFSYERFWGEPADFVILTRDGQHLMLKQPKEASHVVPHAKTDGIWSAYFWVSDADNLYEEFVSRGATIDYELCNQPYHCREFGTRDLDGHDIGFGQPIKK